MTDFPAVPNAKDIQNSLNRSSDFRGQQPSVQMVYYELAAHVVNLLAEKFDEHATLELLLQAREAYLERLEQSDFATNFASSGAIEFSESYAYVSRRIAEELALVRSQLENLASYNSLGSTYKDRIIKLMKFDRNKFKRINAGSLTLGQFLNTDAFPFMTIRL